jgi:cytochrome c oxidase subunit 1
MIFAWLGALFYWFPKYSGRMYSERWGRIGAWWLLISFNLTFLPMFASGIDGMNRRVASYLPYLQDLNVLTSIGGFLFGVGFVIPLVNLTWSWLRGPRAVADPWAGKTLEWRTDSPPPRENFHTEPVVTADFYGYGKVAPEPPLFAATRPEPEPAEGGRS